MLDAVRLGGVVIPRGLVYMAASALGFSAMTMLVKLASARLPTGEIVLARAIVTLVISYVMVMRAGLSPWGTHRGRLALRGILGFAGLAGYYVAVALLPIADATTLQQIVPVLASLLGWWLLGEKIGWTTVFALACGVAGVVVITHPSGAGLGGGGRWCRCAVVRVRHCASLCTEHPLVIVFYFPLIATPLAIPWGRRLGDAVGIDLCCSSRRPRHAGRAGVLDDGPRRRERRTRDGRGLSTDRVRDRLAARDLRPIAGDHDAARRRADHRRDARGRTSAASASATNPASVIEPSASET
jgi:uncharacterized membrane protein